MSTSSVSHSFPAPPPFRQRKKSWADQQGIPTGVMGERHKGVLIDEKNRATVYERYKAGIIELQWYLHNNYRRKGVKAILFGIDNGTEVHYAVFVENNFLRHIEAEGE